MLLKENRNFLLIWQGQLVSQIGSKIYLIALAWYFVSILNNNHGFVSIMLISSLPGLLLGVFIGPFIDRWNKKHIMIISDFISGIFVLLIAFLVYFKIKNPVYIYSSVFILNISTIFFNPAVTSIIPSIVRKEQLQEGYSLHTMVQYIAQFIGCAIGGVLVAFLGVFLTIFLNSVSFFLSALSEIFIKYEVTTKIKKSKHLKEIKEGLIYIFKNSIVLRQIIIFSFLNLFAIPIVVFIPILIDDYLKLSSISFGIAEAGIPVGAIIISLLLTKLNIKNHIRAIKSGLVLISSTYFIIYYCRSFVFVVGALFLCGLFLNMININAISFYAKIIPENFRGRFFSLLDTISFATFPFAYLLTGLLLKHFDLYTLIIINGLAMLLIGIFSLFFIKRNSCQ